MNILNEDLPGVLENRGKRVFISGEQGNKGQILRGTGEQRQYWGTGNIRKQIFLILGKLGNKPIYFRGTREQVPSLGGPHKCFITEWHLFHRVKRIYIFRFFVLNVVFIQNNETKENID